MVFDLCQLVNGKYLFVERSFSSRSSLQLDSFCQAAVTANLKNFYIILANKYRYTRYFFMLPTLRSTIPC